MCARILYIQLIINIVAVIIVTAQPNSSTKSNPSVKQIQIDTLDDFNNTIADTNIVMPKIDLPEYVIIGSPDLETEQTEKIVIDDEIKKNSVFKITQVRDIETVGLADKKADTLFFAIGKNNFKGFVVGGMGFYFTPQLKIFYGDVLQNYLYSIDGEYYLTNGYEKNTNKSHGSLNLNIGTIINSSNKILNGSNLNGKFGYYNGIYRFYGLENSHTRSLSSFNIAGNLINNSTKDNKYNASVGLKSFSVKDSTYNKAETKFDVGLDTQIPLFDLPINTGVDAFFATGGLSYIKLYCGLNKYNFANIEFDFLLNIFATKASMQNLFKLRPYIMASYHITENHKIYLAYNPEVLPQTLSENIYRNKYLSSISKIKHTDVYNSGKIGAYSDWGAAQSHVYLNMQSVNDMLYYSDENKKGVWQTEYVSSIKIFTLSANMFAKLNSNDYFGCNVLVKSIKGIKQLPYIPVVEANCRFTHKFKSNIIGNINIKFVGDRNTGIENNATLKNYTLIDLEGTYEANRYLQITLGVNNLLNTRYAEWKLYREFPTILNLSLKLKF